MDRIWQLRYPGLSYRQVRPGDPLPFADGEFDVVFSNAVVEHVGSRAAQARVRARTVPCRPGASSSPRPNRWFPFEHHTGLPLLHYLPASVFRAMLRDTRYRALGRWSRNLNILTAREFARLSFPPSAMPRESASIRLVGRAVQPGRVCRIAP